MGAEVLEEGEMEPFVTELEGCVAGKTIGLFGSYGWGDGEWMRDWVERMTAAGATVVGGEGVICQDAPDVNLGRRTSHSPARSLFNDIWAIALDGAIII